VVKSHPNATGLEASANPSYVDFVARDLGKIVEFVVPEGRKGLPNLISTKQVRPNPLQNEPLISNRYI
jgi:CTD kinase subunit gamma